MSGYLLDTNCVSELVRPTPEPRVVEWMEAADEALLYLSVLTLGQIRKGLAALPQGKRRTCLEAWLEVDLRARSREESCRLMLQSPIPGVRWPPKQSEEEKSCRLLTAYSRPALFITI